MKATGLKCRHVLVGVLVAATVAASVPAAQAVDLNHSQADTQHAPVGAQQAIADCVCNGEFAVGDVAFAPVAQPQGANALPMGATGTVICGAQQGAAPGGAPDQRHELPFLPATLMVGTRRA